MFEYEGEELPTFLNPNYRHGLWKLTGDVQRTQSAGGLPHCAQGFSLLSRALLSCASGTQIPSTQVQQKGWGKVLHPVHRLVLPFWAALIIWMGYFVLISSCFFLWQKPPLNELKVSALLIKPHSTCVSKNVMEFAVHIIMSFTKMHYFLFIWCSKRAKNK